MDYEHQRIYAPKMACFNCRKCFKSHHETLKLTTCPECEGELHWMGTHFQPPKQNDIDHWKAIEMLYEAGVRFSWYDSRGDGWTRQYKQRGDNMSPFELRQVWYENERAVRTHHYGLPGQRPTHPREVPAYLEWLEQQKSERQAILLELCERLGENPPPGLKGEVLLQKFDDQHHPQKRRRKPLAVTPKKRKRNKLRRFDPR